MFLPGGRYPTRIASVSILPPVALNRRLDFGNRTLDLVVGQVTLRALAVGERKRTIDLGLEFAQPKSLGNRRRRLVGQRLGSPAHDDHRKVVALGSASQLGFAHQRGRGLE